MESFQRLSEYKATTKMWQESKCRMSLKQMKTFQFIIIFVSLFKMPRFCDVNNDKKITLSEWLNCLQAQRIQNEQTKPPLLSEPKPTSLSSTNQRRGPNPLESYLKSD